MHVKTIVTGIVTACVAVSFSQSAHAQALAQNIYSGSALPSQDSILGNGYTPRYTPRYASPNQQTVVEAAETNVHIGGAFMHSQYHENASPGDDETGFSYGFNAGASALVPDRALPFNADLYAALNYEFSAGDVHYGGHYLFSGLPLSATDNAVFNRIEARLGLGFPLRGGAEIIPFVAGGYQSWNRNINVQGGIGTDEFYHSGLAGGGLKLDMPLSRSLVVSATGEVLALIGGGIDLDNVNVNSNFGVSAEERLELGIDYAISGPFHIISSVYWEHFNYSGTKPTPRTYYYYEPLSTTTQFGAMVDFSYSFN